MENKITKEFLVYIIMLLSSIIMIIVGVLLKGSTAGDIFLNVGLSIVSTVVVYLFLKFFSDDPMKPIIDKVDIVSNELTRSVDLLKDVQETGILRVWNTRSDFPINEWITRIENSNGDIRIFCYAMAFLIDDSKFDDVIKKKIFEGKNVEVLLGKPSGKFITERTLEEKNEGNIDERISRAYNRIKSINRDIECDNITSNNFIKIKYHDTPLYASIYILGDSMIVTPQLYGERGALAPILELKKTENNNCLYNKYYKMFEKIWKNESEVVDWRKE